MAPPGAIDVDAITDTTGVTLPDPLSVPVKQNDIYGRRRKSEKSAWGVAAPADTMKYRQKSYEDKPMAKRWDRMYCPHSHVSECGQEASPFSPTYYSRRLLAVR